MLRPCRRPGSRRLAVRQRGPGRRGACPLRVAVPTRSAGGGTAPPISKRQAARSAQVWVSDGAPAVGRGLRPVTALCSQRGSDGGCCSERQRRKAATKAPSLLSGARRQARGGAPRPSLRPEPARLLPSQLSCFRAGQALPESAGQRHSGGRGPRRPPGGSMGSVWPAWLRPPHAWL